MKTTAKITVAVFFIVVMAGGAYAWDLGAGFSDGNPPIWEIFKNGRAIHWIDWKDNKRFAVYDNGTPNDPSDDMVLDKETGLVWERSPSTMSYPGQFGWDDAQYHCNALSLGNRKGWRLPTIQELASLVDPKEFNLGPPINPALPAGHPFINVQWSYYFSATAFPAVSPQSPWSLCFPVGGVVAGGDVSAVCEPAIGQSAWCVRGGQGANPQ